MKLNKPSLKTPGILPMFGLALFFAVMSVLPSIVHTFHPAYEGLTVIRDKDFGNYYSRLERALSGFPSEADNGITPIGAGIDGAQTAGLEVILGTLFQWTNIPAPMLSVVLTPLFVFLLFVLFFFLFTALEIPPRMSLLATSLYFAILFHVVSRVMHPGWSFVPTIGALLSFLHFTKKPTALLAILTGVLLGLLPYLYFWSFTYVWAVCGIAALLLLVTRLGAPRGAPTSVPLTPYFLTALITLTVSLPFFLTTWKLTHHPLYEAVAFRGGFLTKTIIESPVRSILLLLETGVFLSLFKEKKGEWKYLISLAFLLGIFIAIHQNLVHGTLLMFSSHYYPYLVLSSVIAAAYALFSPMQDWKKWVILGITVLFLVGAAKDYLPGYRFFIPEKSDFSDQYLSGALKYLNENGTRDVILTDAHTGRVVTSFLPEGIVYTTHSRFLLISDEEMAERYCMSELFSESTPDPIRALYMEYRPELDAPDAREREKSLVLEACSRVRRDPMTYLQKYGVTHILWNQELKPTWDIKQFPIPLTIVDGTVDWMLLAIGFPTSS